MAVMGQAKIAGLVGVGAAIASMFKPQWAPYTGPLYALCQGVALAGMSAFLEMRWGGGREGHGRGRGWGGRGSVARARWTPCQG